LGYRAQAVQSCRRSLPLIKAAGGLWAMAAQAKATARMMSSRIRDGEPMVGDDWAIARRAKATSGKV
jgi:hypothetical protein